jgi:aspartyl-tRNA(Asn)/glutamyl-tRNA(Gln) amidotransferase subunit C
MSISRQDVLDTALLARLALSEGEVDALHEQLDAILAHMDKLRELDTDSVEPMTHAVPFDCPLRDDQVGEPLVRERALAGAPQAEGDFFAVPRIIERPEG